MSFSLLTTHLPLAALVNLSNYYIGSAGYVTLLHRLIPSTNLALFFQVTKSFTYIMNIFLTLERSLKKTNNYV